MNIKVYVLQISGSMGCWDIHGDVYLSEDAARKRLRELDAHYIVDEVTCEKARKEGLLGHISQEDMEAMDEAELLEAVLACDDDDVTEYIESVYQCGGMHSYEVAELQDLILPGMGQATGT